MEMQDTPSIVANDEEAIEHSKGDCRHCEEIHCGDSLPMIAEKRKPAFDKLRISGRFAHPAGNGSLGNIETEHKKLTVDARRSPGRILGNHPEDQILNLFRNSPSANRPTEPRNGAPIELESSLVPLNDRLGNDDDEKLLPIRPDLAGGDPEQFVEQCQSRPWMPTLKYRELLPESEIL
jgi:hypothetical protein